jgi:cytochrome c
MHISFFAMTISTSKSLLGFLLLTSFLGASKQAFAENDQLRKLMLANNCMACHQIDKRKYGPNFQEVALKYQDDKSAISRLTTKIKTGGSGVWGEDMMPPQAQVSDSDASTLAQLILSLKP